MWDTPFDESMLGNDIIIHCPDEYLAQELMEILERNGVKWGRLENPTNNTRWADNKERTCYWIESKHLSYGSKGFADEDPDEEYVCHIRCTFYGTDTPDFDVATDDELLVFLGIGGG